MFLGTVYNCDILPESCSQLGCAFNPDSGQWSGDGRRKGVEVVRTALGVAESFMFTSLSNYISSKKRVGEI